MEYLNTIPLSTFNTFLIYWGIFGIISGGSLFFSKELPLSSRVPQRKMGALGMMDKKTGWIVMEVPILIVVIAFYLAGSNPINVSFIMLAVFVMHYFNRAIIYPRRIKVKGKQIAILSVLSSMTFYIINGYLIGHYFGDLREYPIEWLYDPRFIIGLILFFIGFVINIHSDNILINLRAPGDTDYKIPKGGMYKYISCPNYLGEIIEWVGFAIMSWSLMGAVYAIWVAVPLIAQSLETHKWYIEKFKDEYPNNRKAIMPFTL
ncbi:MAG: DUF1295 domain-containing protein [Pseudomonadales bacterium]|nr:DUF1295 domain-containing protein [Pseudomonadales bacterium]